MRSWTEDQLRESVRDSHSYCEAIQKLGLRPVGGNYKSVKGHVARLAIDTSHFSLWNSLAPLKRRNDLVRISDSRVFCEDAVWIGSRLRQRVLKLGFIPYSCGICSNPGVHLGKPLTLHLDHKNGNHGDCRKENLRWLCPNCHTQTPTYARSHRPSPSTAFNCKKCGNEVLKKRNRKHEFCSLNCANFSKRRQPVKADRTEVIRLFLKIGNKTRVAKTLGISDVLVGRIVSMHELKEESIFTM